MGEYTNISQNTYQAASYIIEAMKVLLGQIMYDKNRSVRQVSIMTGVSKSTINRIVNGQVSPTLDTVEQLAKGLHLKVTDLFESDIQ